MNTPVSHPEMLSRILAYCEANEISKAEFGRAALGDPRFVYDVETGRECRRATRDKVDKALASKWVHSDQAEA